MTLSAKQGSLRCHLHVGMHKTGTTSVQETFAAAKTGGVRCFPWPPNHSPRLATLYEAEPWRIRNHRLLNRTREDVLELRDNFRRHLRNVVANWRASPDVTDVIFSGEQISQVGFFEEDALTRMRDEFEELFDGIALYGYVRAPRSFIASDFQQVLRMGGPAVFDFERYWPNYRKRFERMDRVFGRDRVDLVKYDRATLKSGDVVLDLAARIGLPLEPAQVVRTNESIGLEAIALLYAIRRAGYGEGGGILKATTLSMWMSGVLQPLSRRKLVLARSVTAGLVERNAADVAWIEGRLSASLDEPDGADGDAVSSEDDLLAIAADLRRDLATLDVAPPPAEAPFREDFPHLGAATLAAWVEEGLARPASASPRDFRGAS